MDSNIDMLFKIVMSIGLSIPRTMLSLTFIPLFYFQQITIIIKIAIVIAISLPISVNLYLNSEIGDIVLSEYITLILKECLLGFLLGYLLAIPFWLFQSVGALIDNQRGALSAGYFNPASGPDASMLGDILNKFVVIIFIDIGTFYTFFNVVFESHTIWHIVEVFPQINESSLQNMLEPFNDLCVKFVLYSGPIILVLLIVECAFAILGTYSPQLQVYFMAMPAKALSALIILIFYLPYLIDLIARESESFYDILHILSHFYE